MHLATLRPDENFADAAELGLEPPETTALGTNDEEEATS